MRENITGTLKNEEGKMLELSAEDVALLLTILQEDEHPDSLRLYGRIIDALD